jgi:hypothetical protein
MSLPKRRAPVQSSRLHTPPSIPPTSDQQSGPPLLRLQEDRGAGHAPPSGPRVGSRNRLAEGAGNAVPARHGARTSKWRCSGAISGDNGVYVTCTGKAAGIVRAEPSTGRHLYRTRGPRAAYALSIASPARATPFFATLLPALGIGPILLLPLLRESAAVRVLSIVRDVGHPLFDEVPTRSGSVSWPTSRRWRSGRPACSRRHSRLMPPRPACWPRCRTNCAPPSPPSRGTVSCWRTRSSVRSPRAARRGRTRLRTVGRHLGSLIEDILTYASLEADRLTVRTAPVRLDELVDSLHPFLEPLAREKGIEFISSSSRGSPCSTPTKGSSGRCC